jgi:hypothetical protein
MLQQEAYSGHVFAFVASTRSGEGIMDLRRWFVLILERGRFVWPRVQSGRVSLSRAQLPMLF